MQCELCEVNEAAVTIIPTGEGMPMSVCPACMARQSLELAKRELPAEEIAAILGPMFVTPAREDLHQEAATERAKRPRKSKAKAEAPQGEADGAPEAPAPAANG